MSIRQIINRYKLHATLSNRSLTFTSSYTRPKSNTNRARAPLPRLSARIEKRFTMSSSAPHPTSSTSEPQRLAEGVNPITPENSKSKGPPEGKDGKKKDKKEKKGGGGALELNPPPEYFAERIKIYDEYKAKYDKWVSGEQTLQNLSSDFASPTLRAAR